MCPQLFSAELKGNKEFMLAQVQQDAVALQHASADLQVSFTKNSVIVCWFRAPLCESVAQLAPQNDMFIHRVIPRSWEPRCSRMD